jgi:hypothetical protein
MNTLPADGFTFTSGTYLDGVGFCTLTFSGLYGSEAFGGEQGTPDVIGIDACVRDDDRSPVDLDALFGAEAVEALADTFAEYIPAPAVMAARRRNGTA